MIRAIETHEAPQPVAPYSQGVVAGNLLFVSGQLGVEPESGDLVADDLERQTIQALENVTAILHAAGVNWDAVARVEIFLADWHDHAVVNMLYGERVQGIVQPARQMMAVRGLPRGARVEISCIAQLPS